MGIKSYGNRAGQVGVFMKGSLFCLVFVWSPLIFICIVNEIVKHSSVQLVMVMHLLAGLSTADEHQRRRRLSGWGLEGSLATCS